MATTTAVEDYLGRRLVNPAPGSTDPATDYLGRSVQAGNKDFLGRALTGSTATGATAGTPGTFTPGGSSPSADLADLQTGVTASPLTAWTTGQHVTLENGSEAHWNGTAWVAGEAP